MSLLPSLVVVVGLVVTPIEHAVRTLHRSATNSSEDVLKRSEHCDSRATHAVFDALTGSRSGTANVERALRTMEGWTPNGAFDARRFQRDLAWAQLVIATARALYLSFQVAGVLVVARIVADAAR